MNILRTACLESNFTGSYLKKVVWSLIIEMNVLKMQHTCAHFYILFLTRFCFLNAPTCKFI